MWPHRSLCDGGADTVEGCMDPRWYRALLVLPVGQCRVTTVTPCQVGPLGTGAALCTHCRIFGKSRFLLFSLGIDQQRDLVSPASLRGLKWITTSTSRASFSLVFKHVLAVREWTSSVSVAVRRNRDPGSRGSAAGSGALPPPSKQHICL